MPPKTVIESNILATAGILTREQLLAELTISPDTLARWEVEDAFPGRKVGRSGLYDVDAIKKWINKKR